ncbi:hypothetical protein EB796_020431 [Bugula neritina]|uniref:Uncharacterized protein n=1 Tax=Bugula neritina TaxID=10212 RepID=A0A7J7J583_BUGNE|nr:hypothetical protein EB796_020431 [Bugula neritina]
MADRAREEEESAKIIPPEGEDYGPNSCVPNQEDPTSSDSAYRFLAFARIFSGKIKKGQKLYVLGPKHDPTEAIELGLADRLTDNQSLTVETLTGDLHMTQITVQDLYTFMGRELELWKKFQPEIFLA